MDHICSSPYHQVVKGLNVSAVWWVSHCVLSGPVGREWQIHQPEA